MRDVQVDIVKCRDEAQLPTYARRGDSGMDVTAAVEVTLAPGETKLVPLGIKVAIPAGYELQIRPRSGLSLRTRLRIPNSPATIDSGYRDELAVIVHNSSIPGSEAMSPELLTCEERKNRQGTYVIRVGDRFAQMVLCPVVAAVWREGTELEDERNRGGGFGHSGVK